MRIFSESTALPVSDMDHQKQAKLVDSAQQFEASLLQELLKPMTAGGDSWGGETTSDDSASDTISSFGSEAMAKAISRGGGFGIAKQVVSQINHEHSQLRKKDASVLKS